MVLTQCRFLDGHVGLGYEHGADDGMFIRVEAAVCEYDDVTLTSKSVLVTKL